MRGVWWMEGGRRSLFLIPEVVDVIARLRRMRSRFMQAHYYSGIACIREFAAWFQVSRLAGTIFHDACRASGFVQTKVMLPDFSTARMFKGQNDDAGSQCFFITLRIFHRMCYCEEVFFSLLSFPQPLARDSTTTGRRSVTTT